MLASTFLLGDNEIESLVRSSIFFFYIFIINLFINYLLPQDITASFSSKNKKILKILNFCSLIIFLVIMFFILILNSYLEYRILIGILEGIIVAMTLYTMIITFKFNISG